MFEVYFINNNQKIFETYQELIKDENFNNIIKIYCNNNQITSLDNLITFNEGVRNPTELDFLPNNLKELYCYDNQITNLDNLPNSLEFLYCYNNQITSLDNLPNSLEFLYCYNNQICKIVDNYFDRDLKKYNLWKQNYLKKFILKIENWFLECKYNPKYKYCQKIVIKEYNLLFKNNLKVLSHLDNNF